MSGSGDYTLYYWGGEFPGRGEFVRLLFEETGTKFKEVGDKETIRKMSAARVGTDAADVGFPCFAVPILKHGDFVISNTGIICRYLGKRFGLWPESEEDQWHAEQLNNIIHDFIAEGRLVFHGKGFVDSYYNQIEETQPYIDWFIRDRLDKWLGYLEKALAYNNGGNGFLVGDKLTYVDLALLHVLRAAAAQFPEPWKSNSNIPLLKSFKDRISARPNLAAYFKSKRCMPFSGNSMM